MLRKLYGEYMDKGMMDRWINGRMESWVNIRMDE